MKTPNALWFHTLQDLVYSKMPYTVSVTDEVLIKVLDIFWLTTVL